MKTACPHCDTVFAVTEEQLAVADGMVRCGVCEQVFSALVQDDLFVEAGDAAGNATATTAQADARAPSVMPDVAAAAGTTPTGDSDHAAELFDSPRHSVVPEALRYTEPGGAPALAATLAWVLGIVLLAMALVLQYAWTVRNELIHVEVLAPWFDRLCASTDCSRLGLRDPGKMEMVSRNIYTHPTASDALMVQITLVNRARYAQRFPDIRIDFSDIVGTIIASRRFRPHEYLALDENAMRPLLPDAPVSFGIEIRDPGERALTYEFSFL